MKRMRFAVLAAAAVFAAAAFGTTVIESPMDFITPEGGFKVTKTQMSFSWNEAGEIPAYVAEIKKDGNVQISRTDDCPFEEGDSNDIIAQDVLQANVRAEIANQKVDTMANVLYNGAVTKIESSEDESGNDTYLFYTSNAGGGQNPSPAATITDYDTKYYVANNNGTYTLEEGDATSESWSIPVYTIAKNSNGKYQLKSDSSFVGLAWDAFVGVDDCSLGELSDGKLQLHGFSSASEILNRVSDCLTSDTKGNDYLIPVRTSATSLEYMKIGKLSIAAAATDADEASIHKHIDGAVTNYQVYGFNDETTLTGAMPYRDTEGKLAWLNADNTEGALLVSAGASTAPAYTAKSERNYYYGTSRPADPGDTVLGWHELPNVTTNYVEGDERTITADTTVDETTGETCKKMKLAAFPEGEGTLPANGILYGAYMNIEPGATESSLHWGQIAGGTIAPLIADGMTTTNNEGKVTLVGFKNASVGQFLYKSDTNLVSWGGMDITADNGLAQEPASGVGYRFGIENFTNRATRSIHTASVMQYSTLLSRNSDGEVEPLSIEFPNEWNVYGYGSIQVANTNNTDRKVSLRTCGAANHLVDGVDDDGNITLISYEAIASAMMPIFSSCFDRNFITSRVDDTYVHVTGDTMAGDLFNIAGVYASTIAAMDMLYAENAKFETATVTNRLNAPRPTEVYLYDGTNEMGEVLYQTLADYVADGDLAVFEEVQDITNAMATAFDTETLSSSTLTVDMTATLPAATTIGGSEAVTVTSGATAFSLKYDADTRRLILTDASGTEHFFTEDN